MWISEPTYSQGLQYSFECRCNVKLPPRIHVDTGWVLCKGGKLWRPAMSAKLLAFVFISSSFHICSVIFSSNKFILDKIQFRCPNPNHKCILKLDKLCLTLYPYLLISKYVFDVYICTFILYLLIQVLVLKFEQQFKYFKM